MKRSWEDEYEVPDEIDFSKGKWIRNPFIQDFRELNLVSLDTELKAVFPNSDAVNKALRELLEQRQTAAQDHSEAA